MVGYCKPHWLKTYQIKRFARAVNDNPISPTEEEAHNILILYMPPFSSSSKHHLRRQTSAATKQTQNSHTQNHPLSGRQTPTQSQGWWEHIITHPIWAEQTLTKRRATSTWCAALSMPCTLTTSPTLSYSRDKKILSFACALVVRCFSFLIKTRSRHAVAPPIYMLDIAEFLVIPHINQERENKNITTSTRRVHI